MNLTLTIAFFVFAISAFGIVDMLRFDADTWSLSGRSRPAWIALSLVFPLAVILYWGTVRYELRFPERYITDQ